MNDNFLKMEISVSTIKKLCQTIGNINFVESDGPFKRDIHLVQYVTAILTTLSEIWQ